MIRSKSLKPIDYLQATISTSPASANVGETTLAFVGTADGVLYAVNTADGSTPWTFSTGGPLWAAPSVGADGGTVYVASTDGRIYALASATGSLIWATSPTGAGAIVLGPLRAPVAVLGNRLYVPTQDHGLVVLQDNGLSGVSEKWRLTTTGEAAVDQKTLYNRTGS